MTLRERLHAGYDPVAGSRILAYRIGRLTPYSQPVAVPVRPSPSRRAGTA